MRARRCDGYELFGVPELRGVTFCRKEGARRVYEMIQALRKKAEPAKPKRAKCRNCHRTSSPPVSAGGECSICGTEDAFR